MNETAKKIHHYSWGKNWKKRKGKGGIVGGLVKGEVRTIEEKNERKEKGRRRECEGGIVGE